MQKISFTTWLTRGMYPRLYLPILAIILLVSVVRYGLMIQAEEKVIQAQRQEKLQLIEHYAFPRLLAQSTSGDIASLKAMLDAEAHVNPNISALIWQHGDIALSASLAPAEASRAPDWFKKLTHLEPAE